MTSQSTLADLLPPDSKENPLERDALIDALYDELRLLANSYLRSERSDHTLQPTALVHEAYLRLAGQDAVRWRNRDHFIAVAATMMRRVLVDHARGHSRGKRGGGAVKLSLADVHELTGTDQLDFLALDVALEKLAKDYPQESKIVELRFFGGLSINETARVLDISESTVERDWRFARAWLLREMDGK